MCARATLDSGSQRNKASAQGRAQLAVTHCIMLVDNYSAHNYVWFSCERAITLGRRISAEQCTSLALCVRLVNCSLMGISDCIIVLLGKFQEYRGCAMSCVSVSKIFVGRRITAEQGVCSVPRISSYPLYQVSQ